MEKETKTIYELGYLLKDGAEKSIVLDLLKASSLELVHEGELKDIRLAYEIKKQTTGQFGYLHFTAENPENIKVLSDKLEMTPEVLRILVIKLPKPESKEKKAKKAAKTKVENIENLSNEKLEEKLEELVS